MIWSVLVYPVSVCSGLIRSVLVCSLQTQERYEKSLDELDKLTPQYMENMEQVFEQWQQFEGKRISFFRELLLEVKQHLDLSSNHRSDATPSTNHGSDPTCSPPIQSYGASCLLKVSCDFQAWWVCPQGRLGVNVEAS